MKTKLTDTVRSPLRYPGGKHTLAPFIEQVMIANGFFWDASLLETHAGGAGAGLFLRQSGAAQNLWLNDLDPVIANLWKCITNPNLAREVINIIKNTQPTTELFKRQKQHLINYRKHSTAFEIDFITAGFSLIFNRCSFSGIMHDWSGPVGGWEQKSPYPLDCHLNKKDLIARIRSISKLGIHVTQKDALDTIQSAADALENWFIYIDPPYVEKGSKLYAVSYSESDHRQLADRLSTIPHVPWLLSYDDAPLIRALYPQSDIKEISFQYTVARFRSAKKELLIKSPCLKWPE